MNCTFFGHGDAPMEIESVLRKTIIDFIENKGVNKFYVGNHGNFDKMAYKILCELHENYDIKFFVVLSSLPGKRRVYKEYKNTVVPEGIEIVPPKFGIIYRNKWMVKQSDYAITYVTRPFGGAAKFKEYAEKQSVNVINLTL